VRGLFEGLTSSPHYSFQSETIVGDSYPESRLSYLLGVTFPASDRGDVNTVRAADSFAKIGVGVGE